MRPDRTHLVHNAAALILGAAIAPACAALGASDPAAALLLAIAAVAAVAWFDGAANGLLAALAAALSARLVWPAALGFSLLFLVEATVVAAVAACASVLAWTAAALTGASEARIRALVDDRRRLRRSATAYARLQDVALDCAAFIVDDRGRIVEWSGAASRLFGYSAEVAVGSEVTHLCAPTSDGEHDPWSAASVAGDGARVATSCRRADGTLFDADVAVCEVIETPPCARVVAVRDRTRDQEWQAFVDAAHDLQAGLREEADVAQRQLATLQYVTAPELNLLPGREMIRVLLDRLREAIDADGVALVWSGRQLRRVVPAAGGLQPDPRVERSRVIAASDAGRIQIVHNDPARVAVTSAVGWCDHAASLIVVPVRSGSHVEGTVEVVGIRTRRSTEWEIALVQVVAAQIAGRARDEAAFDADAVA